MRNLAYLTASFLLTCIVMLALYGCSIPPRKPEPYEQRRTPQHDVSQYPTMPERYQDRDYERWAMRKYRESAGWWNCTRDRRSDC